MNVTDPVEELAGRASISPTLIVSIRTTGNVAAGWRARPERERRLERGVREFVGADGAHQRMAPDAIDEGTPSGDDSGLQTAEELVAAERDEIGPAVEAAGDRRFVAERLDRIRKPQPAAAEVLEQRQAEPMRQRGQLVERRPLGEPLDSDVRRVHPEQQRRPVADRGSAGLLARLISVVPVAAGPPERIHRYTADRLFHEGTGVSFQVWRDAWRERKARELLVNRPELSIKEIAVMVGLGGSGALRRLMRRRLGLTPTQIRDGSRT